MGNNNENASGYGREYYINFVLEAEQRYNTHEVRVSLKTAKMLQKMGFDWECECAILPASLMADKAYHYNHNGSHNYNNKEKYPFEIYSAPTLDVAQRWLREVKNIEIEIHCNLTKLAPKKYTAHIYDGVDVIYDVVTKPYKGYTKLQEFDTYEKAQEAGIQKCLTILLEEKENEKINIM